MKLKPNTDLNRFFGAVVHCDGSVHYRSSEGDELDLKSQLSQYLVATAFYSKDLVVNGSVVCENEEDMKHLLDYLYE